MILIVPCNAAGASNRWPREIRLIVTDPDTPAIATIDTKLGEQAIEAINALQNKVHKFMEPKLLPRELDNKFKQQLPENERLRALWNETG